MFPPSRIKRVFGHSCLHQLELNCPWRLLSHCYSILSYEYLRDARLPHIWSSCCSFGWYTVGPVGSARQTVGKTCLGTVTSTFLFQRTRSNCGFRSSLATLMMRYQGVQIQVWGHLLLLNMTLIRLPCCVCNFKQ